MNAEVAKIDNSTWANEPVPIQIEETEPSGPSSNRMMKMWKAASFGSQSSGPDVDMFDLDWDLCLLCQLQVCAPIMLL